MIAKSTTGASFQGLSNYLENEEKVDFKETHNLAGDYRPHYVRMMDDTASLSKAEKPVYHVSLSYHKADNPSRVMMLEDGHRMLEELELDGHQAVFVAHQDTDHKHLHVMVNRVDPQVGTAWNTFGDHYKLRAICRRLEKERGYTATRSQNPDKHLELTDGEYRQLNDRGLEGMPLKAKADFYELDQLFDQSQSWSELTQELDQLDMSIARKGRGGVLVDQATDRTLKLSRIDSDIGRNQSLGRLEKRFGKVKAYQQAVNVSQNVREATPNNQIGEAVSRMVMEGYGNRSISRAAKKGFREAVQGAWKAQKSLSALQTLASGGPAAGPIKYALKAGKGILQDQSRDKGRSRGLSL